MSHSVDELLREMKTEVRDVEVLPAAAVRARGRRRSRRQLAVTMAAAAVAVSVAGAALAWPRQSAAPIGDRPVVTCVLALPNDPAEVKIRVLDGGAPAGLADTVAAQFRARKFDVQIGTADRNASAGAAALRYGPAAIGAATVVRAEVHGDVAMRFDADRRDGTIDLSLGPAFTRLATATEINQSLALAGEPSAPPQC